VRLATVRAGNVIGGGDWAKDRIVPDCMKAWSRSEKVTIRSPYATRPWQHVLEPLSGYIWLACKLRDDESLNGESFNFGPKAEQNRTVLDLIDKLSKYWDFNKAEEAYEYVEMKKFKEAGLLKLNIDKALFHLDWEPNLNYEQTIRFVSEWYFRYYRDNPGDMYDFTMEQLEEYEHVAIENDLIWTGE
jgi:CDP-glucose 4,6-dehydratase